MARLLIFDGFIFLCAFVLFGYLLGLNKFLTKDSYNGCDMTYMYEYPQFVRVSLPSNVTAEYRRYGLYAYSEGRQTQQTRNMQFSGIPVLFIPGQGGSLKQVRSLASVSLRKSLSSDLPFHFDFFTLDLNEEYSAMFGGVLPDQTRFAVHAVQRVLSLYKRVRPDSIVLIGHSMGGMIAKSLFLEKDFPSKAVRLVVTLATPHSPVLLTDSLLRDYYQRAAPLGPNVTVVSLGGGVKDLVVRAGLTLTKTADISILTTAVSEVWMSVDHLCILWCKQLVLVLVRALFDCVDLHTNQISRDPKFRRDVFKYHLLERSAGKRFQEANHPEEAILQTSRAEWLELTRPHYTVLRPSLPQPLHILVHIPPAPTPLDTMAVATLGHKARDWLFGCARLTLISGGQRVCTTVENLSAIGRIAPTKHKKHKVAVVNLQELRARGLNYMVVRLPPSDEPTSVSYDMFSAEDRTVLVTLPRPLPPLQWNTLLPTTAPDAIFYRLDLPTLERPWHAFHLSVSTLSCSNGSHQAVATLRVPWIHQHSSVVLRNNAETILPILLHTSRPTDWTGPLPYVTLHLDPKCQYSVQIQSSIIELLTQLVRLYSSQLPAYMAAILLLTLSEQLHSLATRQHCLLFHHALLQGAKPYYILPTVKVLSNFLSWPIIPAGLRVLLPTPDLVTQSKAGLDFFILPLFLYCVAFALVFVLGLAAYAGIIFSGSTVNKFALKFVGKLAGVSRTWTDWLMAAIDKVPFVVSAAMVALLTTSCGGLAMLVGTIYYFMRVCGMYEDYIEQLFFAPLKYLKDMATARWRGQQMPEVDDIVRDAEDLLSLKGLTEFNFHMTLVLLWGTATVVHLPSVLVWAHNFRYNPVLDPDPATAVALVSSVCAAVLWTLNTPICPEEEGETYRRMASFQFVMACLVMMFCPISLYNLPILVTAVFVSMAAHQLYEQVIQRWQRLQSSEVTVSNTLSGSTQPSDDESEEESGDPNLAIENEPDSDDDEESSPQHSEESHERSSKNSRTSEKVRQLKSEPQRKREAEEDPEEDPEDEEGDEEQDEDDDEEVSRESNDTKQSDKIQEETNSKEQFKIKKLPIVKKLPKDSDEDLSE